MIIKEKAANECVHLFYGYQASSCLRPCKSSETKSKLVSRMSLNNKDEMRIRIKFKPTVTVTTTDFVKPSLGVFMSEVKLAFVSIHKSLVRNNYQSQVNFCLIVLMSGWWLDGTLARFGSAAGGGDCDKLFSCTDPSSYCQQAIQWGSNTCAAIKL